MITTREEGGRELKAARVRLGMTQAQLAFQVGVAQPTVALAENGGSVSLSTMNAMRRVAHLPPLEGFDGGSPSDRDSVLDPLPGRPLRPFVFPHAVEGEPHWEFPDKRKVDPNIDPIQDEFFTPEGLVDALIRESIQNSLDAQAGDSPVKVRFALFDGTSTPVPSRYLAGLWEHLVAVQGVVIPEPTDAMNFLVIEDFGTVGLTGDVHQYSDAGAGDQKNNFYYFWRNIGRSNKSDTDRGRWGLGKTVFPAASRINSFFGMTLRRGESAPLLMGQSVLKIHTVNGEDFTPYGGFGEFDAQRFVLPVTDAQCVRRFLTDFRLARDGEPGLSVVIPFFRDEIRTAELISATLRHYFYPILTGNLIIEIYDGEIAEVVTAETIDEIVDRYLDAASERDNPEQIKRMLDLARWARTDPAFIDLPQPDSNAPQWDQIKMDEFRLREIRNRYDAGERLRLQVNLQVRVHGARSSSPTSFDIYLEKDPGADRRQRHYIRRGITIPNEDAMRTSGARGLVIIDDTLLSTVLGDAENPAHTAWNERSAKAKEKYRYATGTIRFVKQAFDQAVLLVSRPAEGLEEELLADIFSVQVVDESGEKTAPGQVARRETGPSTPPVIPKAPRPAAIGVSITKTGFTIRSTGKRSCIGQRLLLRTAYELDSGDSFKRYERFDFELNKAPIWMELIGVTPGGIERNEAEFTVEDDTFTISFGGFDTRRDLTVRAELTGGADE